MSKSAVEVMQEAMFSAIIDAIEAMKKSSGGTQNVLLREIMAIHANTTFDSLSEGVRDSIKTSVTDSLKRLGREGYTVAPKDGSSYSKPLTRGKVVDRGTYKRNI